jgi:hypothetical protein
MVPHVDRERDWVETDLLFAGTGTAYAEVERSRRPAKTVKRDRRHHRYRLEDFRCAIGDSKRAGDRRSRNADRTSTLIAPPQPLFRRCQTRI